MPNKISPLGLPAAYPDEVVLPKIPVSGNRAVGALVLPYTRSSAGSIVEISGAATSASGGQVTAFTPGTSVGALSALVLHQPAGNLLPKTGNVEVVLVGSEVRASGEEMEGANVDIAIDGVSLAARSGNAGANVFEAGAPVAYLNATIRSRRFSIGLEVKATYRLC